MRLGQFVSLGLFIGMLFYIFLLEKRLTSILNLQTQILSDVVGLVTKQYEERGNDMAKTTKKTKKSTKKTTY